MDKIVKLFCRNVKLRAHLGEQVRIILLHSVAQEGMDTGNFTINNEVKDPVMGCSLFESLFKKRSRDIACLAGSQELAPAATRDLRFERSRSASRVKRAGFSAT